MCMSYVCENKNQFLQNEAFFIVKKKKKKTTTKHMDIFSLTEGHISFKICQELVHKKFFNNWVFVFTAT